MKFNRNLLILTTVFFACVSCNRYQNISYFQDLAETGKPVLIKTVPFTEPVIQPDDILSVTIQTIDPDANVILNRTGTSTTSSMAGGQPMVTGYRVDKSGNISLPFINTIHLAGLTTAQAREVINQEISKYYKEPSVDVRFANFKVTVLGEVLHPSTYVVPNEKITVFDALGLAGDMTVFGKRQSVLLMRDTLGEKQLVRLDLTSKNIISSPYFYLKQNDVVYVEPDKSKSVALEANRTRTIAILGTLLSITLILIRRL